MFTIERRYAKKFNLFLEEITTDYTTLCQRLSYVDKEISDLLHFLENSDNSIVILEKINQKLRKLRIERRQIKNDMTDIDILFRRVGKKKVTEIVECEYTYRTEVLIEILEDKGE